MSTEIITSEVSPVRRISWIRVAIPVGITLVTLVGLAVTVNPRKLLQILRGADPFFLFVAALKVPIQAAFWTLRWYFIIRTRRFTVGIYHTSIAVMVRSFFNNMTPGAGTGGEPIGSYYLSRNSSMNFKQAMASTASERMCQGVVFVGIVLFSFPLLIPFLPVSSAFLRTIFYGMIGFCGFVLVMLYVSIFQFRYGRYILETLIRFIAFLIPPLRRRWNLVNLKDHLDDWHREFRAFMRDRRVVLWIGLFTVLNWMLDLLQPYFLFKALHLEVPLWLILMNATVIRLTGIFSIIPGGAGLMEGVNVSLYAHLSTISGEAIVAETILFRALDAWILWLASGIITSFAITSLMKNGQKNE